MRAGHIPHLFRDQPTLLMRTAFQTQGLVSVPSQQRKTNLYNVCPESKPHENSLTAQHVTWRGEYKCTRERNIIMQKLLMHQNFIRSGICEKTKISVQEICVPLSWPEARSTVCEALAASQHSTISLACDWTWGPSLLFSHLHLLSLFVKVVELQYGLKSHGT